jgi:hypothetical protein
MIGAGIGAGINVLGGIASYAMHQREARKQQAAAQDALTEQERLAKAARAGLPAFAIGEAGRRAYMTSQQDLAGDIARREAERAGGTTIQALSSAGSKAAIGGVGAAAQGQADMLAKIASDSQARKMAGEEKFAQQEQDVLDANLQAQRELGLFDYGRALGLGDDAAIALEAARGQEAANRLNLFQDITSAAAGASGLLGQGLGNNGIEDNGIEDNKEAEKGAKVRKTPGEFSHKSNPIDLMRNGAKVGEVTGGELIFNPEQSGKIERMASEGDSPLHAYLRDLFRKFNSRK